MTSALITVAPKLEKLIPLLASDKNGEVVAIAAAITRTLKQADADWHDVAVAVARAEPHGTLEPVSWRDIPPSERATWLTEMRASSRLSPWEQDLSASILAQVRFRRLSALSPKQLVMLDRVLARLSAEARR